MTTLFIRSYANDFPWLYYCLQSIRKFAVGFSEVRIVVPNGQAQDAEFEVEMSRVKLKLPVFVHEWNTEDSRGYFDQQISKLHADLYVSSDFITYIDSDTVLTHVLKASDLFVQSRPIYPITPYNSIIMSGDGIPWRGPTEAFMGERVEYEFMRRQMITIPKRILGELRQFCFVKHRRSMTDYVKHASEFSEFNVIGAFCYKTHCDAFHWQNTEHPGEINKIVALGVKQHWSWGGLNDLIRNELNDLLVYSNDESKFY